MMPRGFCSGPMRRREVLQVGALGLGGLTLADVLAARSAAGTRSRETSVILLYLHGGPSQLETYDLKPQAPIEYRSVFQPIATNVPGLDICELFPLQAQRADKLSIVRSVHHDVGIHSDGGIVVMTGKRPTVLDVNSTSKSEHPDFGHIVSKTLGPHPDALPRYVSIPQAPYFTRPTYLGIQYSPFVVGDPSAESYKPPQIAVGAAGQKLDDRRALLRQFDRLRNDLDRERQLANTDQFRDLAFEMLTSRKLVDAFDVAQEPAELRDRYGRHEWGQSCLLARRLTEAGVSVVTLFMNTPKQGPDYTNWDDHILNAGRPGHFGDYMRRRLPYLDQALAALIDDVHARDRHHDVLIVMMGEFGRTPRLSSNASGTGRDHWPQAMSVLFSGGGLRMGQVVGATNSKAEYPSARPCTPFDILATIYRHLGIDHRRTIPDHGGRPIYILPDGDPLAELA